jgi:hypothetical protein
MAKFSYKKADGTTVDIIPTADEVGATPKNVILTDAAASDTLPATTSTAVTSILQTVRNVLKSLIAFKTRSDGFATSAQGIKADNAIPLSQKGTAGGVATLGTDGKVPSSQLPSYVDDVHEYANLAAFPAIGESGKIYVTLDTNKTYRWSGSAYVVISDTLALGETSSTAFAGNRGKALETAINNIDDTYAKKADITKPVLDFTSSSSQTGANLQILTKNYETGAQENLTANLPVVGDLAGIVTKAQKDAWDNKVDKVTSKGLSTNDFTDSYKSKLDSAGSNVYYASTATAIGTALKVVTGLAADYVPAHGDVLNIYMQLGNNVTTPKLSINSTTYDLQFRDVNLTGSANYTIPAKQTISVVYNGTSFQFVINPDWGDNDTLTQLHLGNNMYQAGAVVTKYHLCMEAIDGKLYELCTGDTNATTKTASTQVFKPGGTIIWYSGSATKAANAYFSSDGQVYWYYSNANVNYAFNGFSHCTSYRTVYLKGKMQSGGFVLDNTSTTSWYTTELPTSEDGFVYIKLGAINANTATMFTLLPEHPMVEFRNGKVRPYCPIKLTLDGSNLTITED